MKRVYNIRDIDGCSINYGETTGWKTYLRSDSMHRLTSKDQVTLLACGVCTVLDLRKTGETKI